MLSKQKTRLVPHGYIPVKFWRGFFFRTQIFQIAPVVCSDCHVIFFPGLEWQDTISFAGGSDDTARYESLDLSLTLPLIFR